MTPARAIAFDLDGTLVDSEGDIAAACNHVLVLAGRPPLPAHVIAGFVGDGARKLLVRAFAASDAASGAAGLTTGAAASGATGATASEADVERWHAQFVAYYAAHPADHVRWMPGALEAMAALEARRLPMAVVTNKSRGATVALLDALGVTARFSFLYAGGDGPLKPDAEPVRAVARALGVDVASVWMVGDSDRDVLAAHAAGAVAVAIRGGFADDALLASSRPHVTLDSLAALPALLPPPSPPPSPSRAPEPDPAS